jgi:transposase-like protein
MPQNKIQFQPGMCLSEFVERYGTEAPCEKALEQSRWPDGFVCPEFGGREHPRFVADGRHDWQCSKCRTQRTVCSGTLFHASKLPLTKWFQAFYLVTQNKNNISALSLKRHLCVSSTTAWRVEHKLLESMRRRESRRLLPRRGTCRRRCARR